MSLAPVSRRHAVRGGSWSDVAQYTRVAYRSTVSTSFPYRLLGLRLLRRAA